jgi:2-keto-4-pentenoate hydratase/2-oxohepta-3-ene-1,7-dioic acid hydratase in catechol pathway
MKLLRFGEVGSERPGLLDADGTIRDLSAYVADIAGTALHPASLDMLSKLDPKSLPAVSGGPRIGACVAGTGKFICIGLNYSDHAAETGATVPPEPIIFMKASSAIVGPDDDVLIPRGSVKTDWEVELAVVIGKPARYVSKEDALGYVAGYALHNDYSERVFQLERGGQWVKGKSCDSFAPLGPFLVTRDELADTSNLSMWLDVNGAARQRGTTANMIFDVATLVSYCSEFMTLLPGDVISTGTPAGVGLGMKPAPVYLRPGDEVALGIDGLGESRQRVVAYS